MSSRTIGSALHALSPKIIFKKGFNNANNKKGIYNVVYQLSVYLRAYPLTFQKTEKINLRISDSADLLGGNDWY